MVGAGAALLAWVPTASASIDFVTEWGSFGSGEGQFAPGGLATDSSGDVYVADGENDRVQEFSSSGAFIRAWGWGVADGSNSFQVCTSSCQAGIFGSGPGQFINGRSVATSPSGDVYVAGDQQGWPGNRREARPARLSPRLEAGHRGV
jgi:NHL repeat